MGVKGGRSLRNVIWHDRRNGIITRDVIYAERLRVRVYLWTIIPIRRSWSSLQVPFGYRPSANLLRRLKYRTQIDGHFVQSSASGYWRCNYVRKPALSLTSVWPGFSIWPRKTFSSSMRKSGVNTAQSIQAARQRSTCFWNKNAYYWWANTIK